MVTALFVSVMYFGFVKASYSDEQGVQVLTRGPVHEAFANIVAFNPVPGIVVPKAPPAMIEEVPPDQRPEGVNVAWIPGYWAWDDERNDFLWVSGVWRVLPPGRQWVAGYWGQTDQGFQWICGYWADAAVTQTTYLPLPPATLEVGPNIAAFSPDYFWVPGCWVWYQGRYVWRPGRWVAGRTEWDWYPASYIWTPRGYIFVDGYWDYSIDRRGVLFAPVYFEPGVYGRRDYYYSPNIVIDLAGFLANLFLRPSYHQYYFGDYYDDSYRRGGFYGSYSPEYRRQGYDPIYEQQRWDHRRDRAWQQNVETAYRHRLNNVTARPPRTWAAQSSLGTGVQSRDGSLVIATSLNQLRLQPVAKAEKQQIVQRAQTVRKSSASRQTFEAQPGKESAPFTVRASRSPVVTQPSVEPFTPQQNVNKINRQSSTRSPESMAQPVPVKREGNPVQNRSAEQPSKSVQHRNDQPKQQTFTPETRVNKPESKAQPVPVKREAKPVQSKPAVREAQPAAEQPSTQESNQAPQQKSESPAVEKQSKNDNGRVQTENKGEEQQGLKNKKSR